MQQNFLEAGSLMLAGMIFVFVFLSLLILFINTVLAKLAIRFPDPVVNSQSPSFKKNRNKQVQNQKNSNEKNVNGDISPAIVAAITGAVSRYRSQQGNTVTSQQKTIPPNKN